MEWAFFIILCLFCFIAYQAGKRSGSEDSRQTALQKREPKQDDELQPGRGSSQAGAFMAGYLTSEILNDNSLPGEEFSSNHLHNHSGEEVLLNYEDNSNYEIDESIDDEIETDSSYDDDDENIDAGFDEDDSEDFDGGDFGGGDDFSGGEF